MKSLRPHILTWLAVATLFGPPVCQAQEHPFQDTTLPDEQRIDNLLSLMTIDEKVNCLSSIVAVPRLGIRGTRHVEGLHGLAQGGPGDWGHRDPVTTTMFPQAIGLAESWDPGVLTRVAAIEAYEARYLFQSPKYRKGGLVIRAPNADMGRDPRWGRTEECFGEDPLFNGTMVVAFVRGLQGDHPVYWKTASLMKHFLANSNENDRTRSSSDFDERLFREYYSMPFRTGVMSGGSRAFMTAYNAYNGIPMTVHPVLRTIAINEWGQNGIVCTDGGAYHMLISDQHYYTDSVVAAAACLRAGITQFLDRYRGGVVGALQRGLVTEATLDSALRGSFRVLIRLGLLDPPGSDPYSMIGISDTLDPWLSNNHRMAAREVTRKTVVLLKNEGHLLPLDKDLLTSIAVIGPLADEVRLDWYSGTPPYAITPLAGIRKSVGKRTMVRHATDRVNAASIARISDVAIVCVGNHPTCFGAGWGECTRPGDGREAVDRQSILPDEEDLIREVFRANHNTVVVLISSFPYAIRWTQDSVRAIVHLTHCSQELGNALADVLFGLVNPGGRLVMTWPASAGDLPPMMDYDIRKGRTYMYLTRPPLYPFGFGLSYTTFEYRNLTLSAPTLHADSCIRVSTDVRNSGTVAGDEVVQMYASFPESRVDRPLRQLCGFRRITLRPGESTTVTLDLQASTLAYWSVPARRFVVESGSVVVAVGSSSSDIRQKRSIEVVQ